MAWNNVPKPSESSVTSQGGGQPIGLLLALTRGTTTTSIVTGWSNVADPSPASWTSVAKPTTSNWTNITKPIT